MNAIEQMRLGGRTVVVTGGAGLLGQAYCKAFAGAGARVLLADLDPVRCAEVAAEVSIASGGTCVPRPVDLASEASVMEWGGRLLREFGAPDVLMNNAAAKSAGFFDPLATASLADWNQVMSVNVTAMFLVARTLGVPMASRGGGSIINVSSIYGVVGPDQRIYEDSHHEGFGRSINTPLVYATSKGAVIALTRYLATYWGSSGVRVNTLTPGGIRQGQNDAFVSRYSARVPLGRMGEVEELVAAAVFLASDASNYITGHNLVVDGGWTAW